MGTAAEARTALMNPAGGGKPASTVSTASFSKVKNELEDALKKQDRLKEKIAEGKEMGMRVASTALHGAEAVGTNLLASIAAGRWGKKIEIMGKLDARLAVGLPVLLGGLYFTATGSKHAGHFLALGFGATQSWISDKGREIGEAWSEKKAREAGQPAGAAAPGTTTTRGDDEPDLSGLARSIVQTNEGPGAAMVEDNNRFRRGVAAG